MSEFFKAAKAIDEQILAKYMDKTVTDCPDDSRAIYWLAADMETILTNTDTSMNELLKFIRSLPNGDAVIGSVNIADINRAAEIRGDFAKALDGVEYGSQLSGALGYGFSDKDINNLAILHRDRPEYREKIEDLLEDCNFHKECGDFYNQKYDEYILDKQDPKVVALAKYFDIDPDRISKEYEDGDSLLHNCMYVIDGENRFYLADEKESDKLAKEIILDDIWAFKPDFIREHSRIIKDGGDRAMEVLKNMQESMCESCSPLVRAMIDDLDLFVKDAIKADGRGHFISMYDGKEHKQNGINIYFVDTDEIEKEVDKEADERY